MFLGSLNQIGHFGSTGTAAPVQHVVIGAGDTGIYQTVRLMKQKVREALTQPAVVRTVQAILGGLPAGANQVSASKAIVAWWMANIRYQHDDDMSWTEEGLRWINIHQCPRRFKTCEPVEMVSDVPQILADKKGDCDDFVTGLGAFHTLAGIQWCPVVVALDPAIRREFTHIYMIANLDGTWVPIDAVNAREPWGWQAESYFRKEILC